MICRKCGSDVPDAPFCCMCGAKQDAGPKRTKRGNGEGYVWKRGKSWYATVTLYTQAKITDGEAHYLQKRRTRGGFRTKKEALDYVPILRGVTERRVPSLLDLYKVWEENDLPKLSDSKKSAYKKARERLEPVIGRKIDTLTTSELQETVNNAAESFYTARDMKSLLSHLYKRAMADQFVSVNLSQFIALPELQEKEAEPFTEAEVKKMWEAFAAGDKFLGYPLLMIYSGMMPGELLACKKSMIDLDRCEIWGCGKKTKKRKETPIVFPEFIAPVLSELLEGKDDGAKLVSMNKDNFYSAFYGALERLEIRKLSPYSCRHTTGTEAARRNLTAPVIQNIMRHAKITTSQKYIHLGTEEAHKGVNLFEK